MRASDATPLDLATQHRPSNQHRNNNKLILLRIPLTGMLMILMVMVVLGNFLVAPSIYGYHAVPSFFYVRSFHPFSWLFGPKKNHNTNANNNPDNIRIAICAVQKWGEQYLDEFMDYYLHVLGVDHIYIYDNSDDFELQGSQFQERRRKNSITAKYPNGDAHLLTLRHDPGPVRQLHSYLDCAKHIQQNNLHDWIAFIDMDEFIVLKDKNLRNIKDLLHQTMQKARQKASSLTQQTMQHLLQKGYDWDKVRFQGTGVDQTTIDNSNIGIGSALAKTEMGGLVINWYMFDHNNQANNTHLPMTLRFQRRSLKVNPNLKTIAKVDALDLTQMHNEPHGVRYKPGYVGVDTGGNAVRTYPIFAPNGPTNVAVIHHYHMKSLEEYVSRCQRGRPGEAVLTKKWYRYCSPWEQLVKEEIVEETTSGKGGPNKKEHLHGSKAGRRLAKQLGVRAKRAYDSSYYAFSAMVMDDSAWVALQRALPEKYGNMTMAGW